MLACLDLIRELAEPGYAGAHATREDGRRRLAAAGVRYVVHLRRVHPSLLREQPDQDLVRPASGASAPAYAPRIGPEGFHELFEGLVLRIGRDHYGLPLREQAGDRRRLVEVTGESLVWIAPSITSPMTINWFGSPALSLTNWASPIVPPAPPTL